MKPWFVTLMGWTTEISKHLAPDKCLYEDTALWACVATPNSSVFVQPHVPNSLSGNLLFH